MYKFRTTVLNVNKELSVSLKLIYGLGWYKVNYILSRLGISNIFFLNSLNIYYKDILFFYLGKMVLSKIRLKRDIKKRINLFIDLNIYKGYRHSLGLPVHGQRTRSNANTQRNHKIFIEKKEKIGGKVKKFLTLKKKLQKPQKVRISAKVKAKAKAKAKVKAKAKAKAKVKK